MLIFPFVLRLVSDVKTDGLEFPLVPNVKGYADVLFYRGDGQIDFADGEAQAFDPCETDARTRIEPHGMLVSVFDARRGAINQNPSFSGDAAFSGTMVCIGGQLSQVELLLLQPRRADPDTH